VTGPRLVVEADGGSRGNPGPAGYGAVVRDAATGEVLAEVAGGIGRATNNVAEYQGLLAGLRAAAELEPAAVEVRMDSKLVVEQMAGRWQVKHPGLRVLRREAAEVVRRLPTVSFRHIRRELNGHADRLANEAMDAAARGEVWSPGPPSPAPRTGSIGVRPGSGTPGWGLSTTTPTATLLLRHGATALSPERRFSGTGDVPLSETGREQALSVAVRLAAIGGVDAVVSSPLRRALETAELVGGRLLGPPLAVDDAFRETDFGEWEGATFAEVQERWPEELAAWLGNPDVAPPGGESFVATERRVREGLGRLLAGYRERTVLVVSHVTPIKTLVRLALDAPPAALYRMHLDPGGLSAVDWYADGPAVVRLLNDTAHLAAQD